MKSQLRTTEGVAVTVVVMGFEKKVTVKVLNVYGFGLKWDNMVMFSSFMADLGRVLRLCKMGFGCGRDEEKDWIFFPFLFLDFVS